MRKPKRSQRILSLDPGTRYWGWSLLRGEELYDSGVKTLKTNGSSRSRLVEARKVFSRLLENYAPHVLVLEKPFFFWSKQSNLLNVIIEELKNMARRKKIKIFEFSPRTVRKAICGDGNATKVDMAKVLAMRFPDLVVRLNQDKKYQERYWHHSFDAVGLGVCCIKNS
ncbi:MAG: crossover junction endodeoxyribonuclease RuvC [bacterium]|nr:crossover junction endodeoxyribonuclease RuvC [bacterium]